MIPKTHEYLFHFLDADFSRLESYARSYLSCIDTKTPENSVKGDSLILQRMFEELFSMHPYYRTSPSGAAALLNSVFARYVLKVIPEDTKLQVSMMNRVCTEKYLGEKNVEHWLENPTPVTDDSLFLSLYELQQNLIRWVFLSLDNTNPDLAALTGQQRSILYSLIFGSEYVPLLETRVEKTMLRPHSLSTLSAALDFDEEFCMEAMNGIAAMQKDPTTPAPESIRRILDAVGRITEDCERYTYITNTLEDLLKYEVYDIIQNEVRVKRCKYCNRYFVLEKGNLEYCDRIATGETKPCNDIGKSRTYEQRITGGNSAMALYRKAYKTHFARIRSGNMTTEEFDLWKAQAADKRRLAETGNLAFDEYTTWLKQ